MCQTSAVYRALTSHSFISFYSFADWEGQKNAEAAKESQSQSVAAEASATISAPSEAFTQPVTMMPVPV